jgi:hypothetical protein
MYLFVKKFLKSQLGSKFSMKDETLNVNELENLAQNIFGGRIVNGNLSNYGSFSVAPMAPLAILYGPRITIDMDREQFPVIHFHNKKYKFKAERLADSFGEKTGYHWIVSESIPKKMTLREKKFWKNVPQ